MACLNNLRQIGINLSLYNDSNSGRVPSATKDSGAGARDGNYTVLTAFSNTVDYRQWRECGHAAIEPLNL